VQSGFHEAAGLKRHSRPTIGLFAGSNLGGEPSAGGPGGPPKAEAQGMQEKLAVLARAGGRSIGRANANALAAEGNAGRGSAGAPRLLQQCLPVTLGLV
jgi:hypothetical protein